MPSPRLVNLAIFLACLASLGYAYYSQFGLGYEPCPLCILQRIGMMAVGLIALLATVHGPGRIGTRVYAVLTALATALGGTVSGRHVWLQHLPADQVPACGPGLEYMLDVLPFAEAMRMVFTGSGECAVVDWTFLGLSMPTWVLALFVVFGVVSLVSAFRPGPDSPRGI